MDFEWTNDIDVIDPILTDENVREGLRVELLPDYYDECEHNPLNMVGVIIKYRITVMESIHVKWDNECENVYWCRELKIIGL